LNRVKYINILISKSGVTTQGIIRKVKQSRNKRRKYTKINKEEKGKI